MSFVHFLGMFSFTLLNFENSSYILDNSPLSDMSLENVISQTVVYLLSLDTTFHREEFLNFSEFQFTSCFLHRSYFQCCI